ncbi:DUF537-domain-containing protein [Heliocybe sulcata]|uniref:DUF537-domain-containing protein n=1 Tax=Heliocybe sulcata TaxID=5364 RepID=A0A5C3NEQ4_9AGAM|nr:DUF537-domain-containing protein [Heliocybe sulcata]
MSTISQESVSIFWDFENCTPSSSLDAVALTENIRHIANRFGKVTSFKAYIDLGLLSTKVKPVTFRAQLQASGVLLIDTPHRNSKEVADKVIIVDMLAWAMETKAPATVILITGDSDFAYAVSVLRMRLYRVVLITPRISSTIRISACLTFSWESNILPPKPVQRKAIRWHEDDLASVIKPHSSLTAPRRSWEAAEADIRTLISSPQGSERPRPAERRNSLDRAQCNVVRTMATAVKRRLNEAHSDDEEPSKRLCKKTLSVEEHRCPPERVLRTAPVASEARKVPSFEKLPRTSVGLAPSASVAPGPLAVLDCRLTASTFPASAPRAPLGLSSRLFTSAVSSSTPKEPPESGHHLSASVSSSSSKVASYSGPDLPSSGSSYPTSDTLVHSSSSLSQSAGPSPLSSPIEIPRITSSDLPMPGIAGLDYTTPRKLPSFRKHSDPVFQSNQASAPSKSSSEAGGVPCAAQQAKQTRPPLSEKNGSSRVLTQVKKDGDAVRTQSKSSSGGLCADFVSRDRHTIQIRNDSEKNIPREFLPLARALEWFRVTGENCADTAKIEETIATLSQHPIEKIYQDANVRKLRQYLELAVLAGIAVKTRGRSCACMSMHLYLHPKWHGWVPGMNYSRFLKWA